MRLPIFKIRASCIGHIMSGDVGMSESKIKKMNELKERKKEGKKPLTEKMEKTLSELIEESKITPELPQGAKSYCQHWLKTKLYGFEINYDNKYTNKGNFCEDDSIRFINNRFNWNLEKNEEFFENEYIQGTPDLINGDRVIDVKTSWDFSTFPLFNDNIPNKDYHWQVIGYMDILKILNGSVYYCLVNTPQEIDKRMIRYDECPEVIRIKTYDFEYDEKMISKIYNRVIMCRDYINEIYSKLNLDDFGSQI